MPATLITYGNDRLTPVQYPEDARWTAGRFGASLTLAVGTVLGVRTSDGLLYAYNSSNTDGTQTAVGLLMYAINTDSNKNVFFQGSTTVGPLNVPENTAPYFVTGTFDTADLTGYDATALSTLKGRLLANGFLHIP